MSIAKFNESIRSAIVFFEEVDALKGVVFSNSLNLPTEFKKISMLSEDYNRIYEMGLSLSCYNFLLYDLSYFQFTYKTENEYALAYYPNPRLSGSAEALSEYRNFEDDRDQGHWNDEEFSELVSDIPIKIIIPRIRFEYSLSQYQNVRHPGAHFHIGMFGEDRWTSARKLSPLSFSMLMAKYYHPLIWWPKSRFSKHTQEQHLYRNTCFDRRLLLALQEDGVSQLLSNDERMSFHFAAFHGHGEF